jgi:hypothetical protein
MMWVSNGCSWFYDTISMLHGLMLVRHLVLAIQSGTSRGELLAFDS